MICKYKLWDYFPEYYFMLSTVTFFFLHEVEYSFRKGFG